MSVEWFRSWHGAPLDPKWRTIAKRAKVPTCVVSCVAWALMDRASQSEDRGSIAGVDVETLADFLDCEPEQIERIIAAMREKGVLDGDRFPAWEKRQPKRERDDDASGSRVEAHRLRKKISELESALQTSGAHVTPCNATKRHETPREEESREDKKLNTEILETSLDGLVASPSAPRKASRAKPRSQISDDAQPSEADREAASHLPQDQFRTEWRKFRDHHRAKGSVMADWSAAWRTWVGNIAQFQQARAGPAQRGGVGELYFKLHGMIDEPEPRKIEGNPESVRLLPIASGQPGEADCDNAGGVFGKAANDLIGRAIRRM